MAKTPFDELKLLKDKLEPALYQYLLTSEDLELDIRDVTRSVFIPELDNIYKMCHKNRVIVTSKQK